MRHALLAATLLVAWTAQSAHAQSVACAVRLQSAGRSQARKAALLESVLQSLPKPPLEVRPLLAGGADAGRPARPAAGAPAGTLVRGGGPGDTHPLAVWQVFRFESSEARDAALDVLSAHPHVVAVEAVRTLRLEEAVARSRLPRRAPRGRRHHASAATGVQGTLQEIPWNVERIGALAALAEVVPDSSLIVGVIDTGADLTHPDLAHRLWRNDDPPGNGSTADDAHDQNGDGVVEDWERQDDDDNGYVDDEYGFDFTDAPGQAGFGDALGRDADPSDDNGHGTHVAGIVAADGALRGVAPFVRLMPVRAAFNTFGGGLLETDDAAAAIVYAVDNGARVVNLSWGDSEESRLVREAVAYAVERGVLVVAAAGNAGSDAPHYPSGDPRVIGVAASNRTGGRASFSNFGAAVEIAAPGEESAPPGSGILSLEPLGLDDDGDGLRRRRGTSMAAPHVAGAAAILMSRADRPDARRVRALLVSGTRRRGDADWTPELGHGELDVLGAVRSRDDLVVAVHGPSRPYRRGRLLLLGTILSGDLPRRRIDARHLETGRVVRLASGPSGQVVADTLVDAAFADVPEGAWEYVVAVESAGGRRRERHGAFTVDTSAPAADTLFADAAWRGRQPRWLLTLRADEEVQVRVGGGPSGETLFADAGLSSRIQVEGPAQDGLPGEWRVSLENAAGLATEVVIPQPAVLPPWPQQADLIALDAETGFRPEPVWGRTPAGTRVVWGRGESDGASTMQAWSVTGGTLVHLFETGESGRPVAFEDVNGDAAADLLFQRPPDIHWLLTRQSGSLPDSLGARVRAERVLGLFQLDDDAAFEAILSSGDSLLVYDDAVGRTPPLVQTLVNPSRTGFNIWGADAAVGDLDADGRIEIACGDGEGFVSVFERAAGGSFVVEETLDTGGTYAYDLSVLPDGGFLVGRQRTALVTGDGFPTAVYEFLVYVPAAAFGAAPATRTAAGGVPEANGYRLAASYPFLSPENELGTGSVAVRSSATGEEWLSLVRGGDLYLARGGGEPRALASHLGGVAGEAPVLADLDDDGALEMLVRTPQGAGLYRLQEGVRGPHSLHAESQGVGRVRLAWVPGGGEASRVRRRRDGVWETLGETTASTWIDSTVVSWVLHQYEVQAIAGGETQGVSNRVTARAQPRPRLLGAEPLGAASLRLRFSNAMQSAALLPWRFHLATAADGARRILQATVSEAGRAVDLVLDASLPCGTFTVRADSLRDDQNGLLDPPRSELQGTIDCPAAPFFVRQALLRTSGASGVEIQFSREPQEPALDVATYALSWDGSAVPIARVDRLDAWRYVLVTGPGVEFVGRGIPYLLQVDANLRAAGDGAALEAPATVFQIHVSGKGAARLFPYPNPASAADDEVVFADAAADTRVRIYNLEGELVRELRDARSGGLRWDLRGAAGRRVQSGVYIWVARDSRGRGRGRIAVVR
ncbi:MAG: S8 family serine peptidase [Candidatus Krumholzibacteriia bacterium]